MVPVLIGVLVLAVQATGVADTSAAAPVPPGPPTAVSPATVTGKAPLKDPSQKVVCKSEAPIGSLIPSRVCRTQETWDAMRDEGQRATANIQRRALTVPTAEMNRAAN